VLYDHLQQGTKRTGTGLSSTIELDRDLEQEYEQLQQLLAQYPESSEQRLQLLENYKDTYWYYYSKTLNIEH
jgi:enoyl reductase-like protein